MASGELEYTRNIELEQPDFGARIEQLRGPANLTKRELAERCGLAYRTIHDIEIGKRDRVQEKTLRLIAEALGLSYDELVNGLAQAPRANHVATSRGPHNLTLIVPTFVVGIAIGVVATLFVIANRAGAPGQGGPPERLSDATPLPSLENGFDADASPVTWIDESDFGSFELVDGALVLSKHAHGKGFATARMSDEHVLRGDFDIQVDYTLEAFDYGHRSGNVYATLRLLRADNDRMIGGISRDRRFGNLRGCTRFHEYYRMFTVTSDPCDAEQYESSERRGRMRIVRRDTELRAYVWRDGWWFEGLRRPTAPDDVGLAFAAGSGGNVVSAQRVTFSNLVIRTGPGAAGTFTEDFDDHDYAVPVSVRGNVETAGGKLVMNKPGDGDGAIEMRLDPSLVLDGDFDIRVDFELIDFPPIERRGVRYHTLALADAVTRADYLAANRLRLGSTECAPFQDCYAFFTDDARCPANEFVVSSDERGRLRLERDGTTVRGYYWDGSDWVMALERTMPVVDVSVLLYSGTTELLTEGHVAAFDNLVVTSR